MLTQPHILGELLHFSKHAILGCAASSKSRPLLWHEYAVVQAFLPWHVAIVMDF